MEQQQLTMHQKLQILNNLNKKASIKCDNCGEVFDIYLCKESVKLYNRGNCIITDHIYFRCPKCKSLYTAYLVDNEVKRLIEKRNKQKGIVGPDEDLSKLILERFKFLRSLYAKQKAQSE